MNKKEGQIGNPYFILYYFRNIEIILSIFSNFKEILRELANYMLSTYTKFCFYIAIGLKVYGYWILVILNYNSRVIYS